MSAARKSRVSKTATTNRNRFSKRDFGVIRPRPIIIVVVDDSKTAVGYLNEISRAYRSELTLRIIPAPCDGATPDDVIGRASDLLGELSQDASHDIQADQQKVWVLIDLEVEPHRQAQAFDAKKKMNNPSISISLSNPCYEVWTLLHLEDTGSAFGSCRDVLKRVQSKWMQHFGQEMGPKSQADYSKLMPLFRYSY